MTKDPFTLPRPPALTLPDDGVKNRLAYQREQLKALPTAAPPTAFLRQFSPEARRARETLETARQTIAASEAALRQEIAAREAALQESAAREAALRQEIAGHKEQLRALEAWAEQFGIPLPRPAPVLPADPPPVDPSRLPKEERPIDHARRAVQALWPEGDPGPDKLLLKTAVEDVNAWLADEARLGGCPPLRPISPDTVSRALGRRK